MTITPISDEPGRYWVTSETDGELWLVDLWPGPDMPHCACAIEHNRTAKNWNCHHVRAVIAFARSQSVSAIPGSVLAAGPSSGTTAFPAHPAT